MFLLKAFNVQETLSTGAVLLDCQNFEWDDACCLVLQSVTLTDYSRAQERSNWFVIEQVLMLRCFLSKE